MTGEPKVWPPFLSQRIIRSSSQDDNQACPYLLSRKILGTGSYSAVFECKNTSNGAHYAAKQYAKRLVYGMESLLQSEFKILKRVSFGHKNILSLIDYFETEDHFYLVTDLALGGDLFERITGTCEGRLQSNEAREILLLVLSALAYLHSNQIVHRDVKAENILFKSRTAKPLHLLLADFGLAQIVKDSENGFLEHGGTLSYMAPECLSDASYGYPVDMWAVGVLTYFMLCGYMPFDCDTDKETEQLISTADFIFEPIEYWEGIPDSAKDFISQCFILDADRRITAVDALSHPFILNTPLKRTASNFSMSQLQAAVWRLHSIQSLSSSTRLAQLLNGVSGHSSILSRLSLNESSTSSIASSSSHRLLGDRCYSPELVSRFCTPLISAQVSPTHSQSNLKICSRPTLPKSSGGSSELRLAEFFI